MTQVAYAILKEHFDKIFRGQYQTTGLEDIIDVYRFAFNQKVHMMGICQTDVNIYPNNPITRLVTFIGTDSNIRTGVMPCINSTVCTGFIDKNAITYLNKDNIFDYIMSVYSFIYNVIIMDRMYSEKESVIRSNPYSEFLILCPLYFTYYHIKTVAKSLIQSDRAIDAFTAIAIRNICREDQVHLLLNFMYNNSYSTDFEDIFKIMTCNNSLGYLYD